MIVVSAVLAAVIVTGLIVAFTAHTDSDKRFVKYVHMYATGWRSSKLPGRPQRDQAWIDASETAVVAAGRRSCAWLGNQPDAPGVDTSGYFDTSRMAMRYVKHVEGRDIPVARLTKWGIVVGAWNYLCRDEMTTKTVPFAGEGD